LLYQADCLTPFRRFADHDNILVGFYKEPEAVPYNGMVISEKNPYGHGITLSPQL
jgi:hypothetical protein